MSGVHGEVVVQFRPIASFPGYRLGSDRSVWSELDADGARYRSRWSLRGSPSTPGASYRWILPDVRPGRGAEVLLWREGRKSRRRVSVDRLMARLFPPAETGRDDGGDDADGVGPARAEGDGHGGRTVLNEPMVAEMRRLKAEGWGYKFLQDRYGVSRSTVHYALTGATWRHVMPEDEHLPAPGSLPRPAEPPGPTPPPGRPGRPRKSAAAIVPE
ncbi:MAG: hypothetical protein WKF75_00385 [Singulisphaera sp.]